MVRKEIETDIVVPGYYGVNIPTTLMKLFIKVKADEIREKGVYVLARLNSEVQAIRTSYRLQPIKMRHDPTHGRPDPVPFLTERHGRGRGFSHT